MQQLDLSDVRARAAAVAEAYSATLCELVLTEAEMLLTDSTAEVVRSTV